MSLGTSPVRSTLPAVFPSRCPGWDWTGSPNSHSRPPPPHGRSASPPPDAAKGDRHHLLQHPKNHGRGHSNLSIPHPQACSIAPLRKVMVGSGGEGGKGKGGTRHGRQHPAPRWKGSRRDLRWRRGMCSPGQEIVGLGERGTRLLRKQAEAERQRGRSARRGGQEGGSGGRNAGYVPAPGRCAGPAAGPRQSCIRPWEPRLLRTGRRGEEKRPERCRRLLLKSRPGPASVSPTCGISCMRWPAPCQGGRGRRELSAGLRPAGLCCARPWTALRAMTKGPSDLPCPWLS